MRPKITYRQMLEIDSDWPGWILPGVVILALFGGAFEYSGHNPWVAGIGLGLVFGVILPVRMRQLERRIAERDAKLAAEKPTPPAGT